MSDSPISRHRILGKGRSRISLALWDPQFNECGPQPHSCLVTRHPYPLVCLTSADAALITKLSASNGTSMTIATCNRNCVIIEESNHEARMSYIKLDVRSIEIDSRLIDVNGIWLKKPNRLWAAFEQSTCFELFYTIILSCYQGIVTIFNYRSSPRN